MLRSLQKPWHLMQSNKQLTATFFGNHIWAEDFVNLTAAGGNGITRNYCSTTNPENLPRLPVPPLKDTLQRYLKTAAPFLSGDELKRTKQLCDDFEQGVGAKLQNLLLERAKNQEDWMAEWWVKYGYLAYRDPVVVYSNPGLAFPKLEIKGLDDQIDYAAKMIHLALKHKQIIDAKKIPQEKMGKFLLDMGQYYKIFGTCRIPGKEIDSMEYHSTSKHIVFFYKNNIFQIPTYGGPNGDEVLGVDELKGQIKKCIEQSTTHAIPIGVLTSDQRDNWGKAYEVLTKDPRNVEAVKQIQTSLFVMALDEMMPGQNVDTDINVASHQLITGGGANANSGNRWYDKTIQFIIGNEGINGITYEHTPAEGQPVALMVDQILKQLKDVSSNSVGGVVEPTKLNFNVTSELNECIATANSNITKLSANLDMEVLHFTDYGKDFIKTQKLSPDSFIQMAIQYAFYRLHKTPGAHYESAHTRMYIHGRTETIRSCSLESIAFAKAMTEPVSDQQRAQLLRDAIKSHKDYTTLALQGFGVDRHFFALKLIANENNIPIPDFYKDPGYLRSAHMRLSTSQVASVYESFMCYGPLVENGYGCCYNPREKDMFFACSSMKSCAETSSKTFAKTLGECFREMRNVLERVTPLKSKL